MLQQLAHEMALVSMTQNMVTVQSSAEMIHDTYASLRSGFAVCDAGCYAATVSCDRPAKAQVHARWHVTNHAPSSEYQDVPEVTHANMLIGHFDGIATALDQSSKLPF
jgi:hypothetical protein